MVAEFLYHKFPQFTEGELTRLRAQLVNKHKLAELARTTPLASQLRLGSAEQKSGGTQRDSILADALEAVIGAIYLDSDINACRQVIEVLYQHQLADLKLAKDPKTQLQEFLQAKQHPLPDYQVLATTGKSHALQFTVACHIDLLAAPVQATGPSRRLAEQAAAEKVLALLAAKT